MMITFIDRNGNILEGKMVYKYSAFEGGMRYIIKVGNVEYRCVRDERIGQYVEYVA